MFISVCELIRLLMQLYCCTQQETIMNIDDIKKQIEKYQAEGKKMFTTSSFQSHSIVLLHILSKIDASIPVYFINTATHRSLYAQFQPITTYLALSQNPIWQL